MKRYALPILLILALPLVSGLMVRVEVRGTIEGNIPYQEITDGLQDRPFRFLITWENTGSVGCDVVLRTDVYAKEAEKKSHVYTAWSESTPIESGATGNIEAYWLPGEPGEYEANLSIILCNNFLQVLQANISINESQGTFEKAPFEVLRVENDEKQVEFEVKSEEDLEELIIIPTKYPLGWRVDSKAFRNIGGDEPKILSLDYEPGIKGEKEITFELLANGGKYKKLLFYTISLEKKRDFWSIWTIPLLIFLVVILTASNLCLLQRERLSRFKRKYLTKGYLGPKLDKFRKERARKKEKKD
ncbi:MAG: hypothetical protein JXB14_05620 [Candidatus Altiarchaeota archaeon]|nr:hypothetical protein [Candidatus Altiarchaeota archaeon]